jgi:hypothetical protein
MHHQSPYESDDNCGTCDGANCNTCREYYKVDGLDDMVFWTEKDALAGEKQIEKLIPLNKKLYMGPPKFFIKDDVLNATIFLNTENIKDCKYIDVLCNNESILYLSKFREIETQHLKYAQCRCIDKADPNNECSKYGCTDKTCYREMMSRNRRMRKVYP